LKYKPGTQSCMIAVQQRERVSHVTRGWQYLAKYGALEQYFAKCPSRLEQATFLITRSLIITKFHDAA
jgi:hypothetical protein